MMVIMSTKVHQIQSGRSRVFFHCSVDLPISKKKLEEIIKISTEHFEKLIRSEFNLKSKEYEFSLSLCGARKMQTINREHRGKDKATDVLTFPLESMLYKEKNLPAYLTQLLNLGDIVICKEVLIKQSKSYNVSLIDELVRLLAHGMLHLVDLDHERSPKEEKYMFDLQDKLIAKILKRVK